MSEVPLYRGPLLHERERSFQSWSRKKSRAPRHPVHSQIESIRNKLARAADTEHSK